MSQGSCYRLEILALHAIVILASLCSFVMILFKIDTIHYRILQGNDLFVCLRKWNQINFSQGPQENSDKRNQKRSGSLLVLQWLQKKVVHTPIPACIPI